MKKASVWALSALFGCISLFGPGWHCFVGHEFHASHGCHESCDDHDHAARGSEHSHEAAEASPAAVAVHDHDCPICSFFAQSQWAFELGSAELELTACGATALVERRFWVERISSYQSRAPPIGAPIC